MWIEILTAYLFIVVAELGDKSQLLAMALATKYRTRTVLAGVFFGILLSHAMAILFGSFLQAFLSPTWTTIIIGTIFVLFGLLSLLEQPHNATLQSYKFPAVVSVATLFFVGELGDKTQFATMALSLDASNPWALLIGTVPAMMTTSILAIWVGKQLGRHIPELTLKIVSTTLFVLYGSVRLSTLLLPYSVVLTIIMNIIILSLFGFLVVRYRRKIDESSSAFLQVAQELKDYFQTMRTKFETICLTEKVCGVCKQEGCILGHIKYLIEQGKEGNPVSMAHLRSKTMRKIDPDKLHQAKHITIEELKHHWEDPSYQVLHQIRQNIEFILYKKTLRSPTYEDYQNDIVLLEKKTQSTS